MQKFHEFASDRPISKRVEDTLGRAGFASHLADAILGWHSDDSLVIALNGEWGSGKTSVKKMVLECLNDQNFSKANIVEFSPWEWGAQEKITSVFFQEISKEIGINEKGDAGRDLAKILKKYGTYLSTGGKLVSGIPGALPIVVAAIASIGVGGTFIENDLFKGASALLLSISVIVAAAFNKVGEHLNKGAAWLEEKYKKPDASLNSIRGDLKKELKKRDQSLIIILDDLDRLTSDQVRNIIQLVKANSDLPKVIFLLLYQRDLVEAKLKEGEQSGASYLEKIIQVQLNIPEVDFSRLRKNLEMKIVDVFTNLGLDFGESYFYRWKEVFDQVLYPYFKNLRCVNRFITTLAFHASIFKGEVFEGDLIDLVAIEFLRVFEPDIHKEISQNKTLLTSNLKTGGNVGDSQKLMNHILSKATEGNRERIVELLRYTFPSVQAALGGAKYEIAFVSDWSREGRVCHPRHFDKYFQLTLDKNRISRSELQRMYDLTANAVEFSNLLISLRDRGLIKDALSAFISYSNDIPLINGGEYIKGLLDVGDQLDVELWAPFESSLSGVEYLTWSFLGRIGSCQEKGKLLKDSFGNSKGIAGMAELLRKVQKLREDNQDIPFLDDDNFETIKKLLVQRVVELYKDHPEKLLNHVHLASLLRSWKDWGNDPDEAVEFVKSQLSSIDSTICMVKRFCRKVTESGKADNIQVDLEELSYFIQPEKIEEVFSRADYFMLEERSREIIDLFNKSNEMQKRST